MSNSFRSPSDGQLFAILVAGCAVIVYWKFFLIVIGGTIGLLVLYMVADDWHKSLTDKIAARRAATAALIEHADREHRLIQQGDLDGIYGEYPVPDECRGIGIWLAG